MFAKQVLDETCTCRAEEFVKIKNGPSLLFIRENAKNGLGLLAIHVLTTSGHVYFVQEHSGQAFLVLMTV